MLLPLLLLGAAAPELPAASVPAVNLTASSPAVDAVSDLLAEGKKLLLGAKYDEAVKAFEAAHEKSGGKVDTELWLLRARMSAGDLDESFDRIVELESSAKNPADVAYVIGVGRYLFAKREEARGGAPGGPFDEARGYLKDAVDADASAYPDAWLMLAESARFTGDAETASMAIERALEQSKDSATLGLAAKIRIAKGAGLVGVEETKEAGQRMIAQGVKDAHAALKGIKSDKANASSLADMNLQLAVGLLYQEKKDEAAGAYAEAMGWDPTQVDYGQLFNIYRDAEGTSAPFVDALTSGGAKFEERWGKDIASDATLRWWLGYAQQSLGKYDDAIGSFEQAVAKFPAFANSHWYIGLSKYNKGAENYVDAVHSWREYANVDRAGFVALVNGDATNKRILGFVQGNLYGQGIGRNKDGIGMEEAADAAELVLLTDETDARQWNNVGLFHRDAGQVVAQMRDYEEQMTAKEHYERSWEAYSRALEMSRTSYHLNDAAVLLHYYLERDYDKAIAMYDEAEAMAAKRLEEGGLSTDEKPLVEIALRDAKDNRAKLKKKIEDAKKKKEEAETPKEGPGDGGGDGDDAGTNGDKG